MKFTFTNLRTIWTNNIYHFPVNFWGYFSNLSVKKMSVFTQKFIPMLGKCDWEEQHEEYDFHQEIARSAYADMLHDKERNDKYSSALKTAIQTMKLQKRPARVLDIGTGTGLLSMMAAVHGADKIVACEAFQPMAKCAAAVIKKNGFDKKIKVIPKRSTELIVGCGCDLEERANILVTEVFDTELIGEGALETFSHALQNLLEADCIVVPTFATVYAQVLESDQVLQWSKLRKVTISGEIKVLPPKTARCCSGASAAHDVQLSQLPTIDFVPITNPVIVMRFDFSGKTPLKFSEFISTEINAKSSGTCEAVFMWWELEMLPQGDILSCAPAWAHPDKVEWRDHWLQSIYYLKETLTVDAGDTFFLSSYHDEYSFWFSVNSLQEGDKMSPIPHPVCTCGVHTLLSHNRIAMLNDKDRNFKFASALKKVVKRDSICFSLSHGSLLPLIAAKVGAQKVYAYESNALVRQIMDSYNKENAVANKICLFESMEELESENVKKVDVIMGDPFFISTVLPWDNLYFWSLCSEVKQYLSASTVILPSKATIWGVAVSFVDLWKIRAPIGTANNFDLTPFDEIIQQSMAISDEKVEPQPLWEYPCIALTENFEILNFDFTENFQSSSSEAAGLAPILSAGNLNGIALWMDYNLYEDNILSTGPTSPVVPGEKITWYRFSQQGVYFLTPCQVFEFMKLKYYAKFSPQSGEVVFDFNRED